MAAGRRGVLDRVLVDHRLHDANASGCFERRERMHAVRRTLRGLTPFRFWAECGASLESYFPLASPLRPEAVAAEVARSPTVADAGALACFRHAGRYHSLFLRYFSGARNRQV